MSAALDPSHSKLLGALTLVVLKHLGEATLVVDDDGAACTDWRMARVGGDIALVEKPADDRERKRIECYSIVERSASGHAFKLDPARLVYSLRWQHNGSPPDFELMLVQPEPERWVGNANMTLLAELRQRAPSAIDWASLQPTGVLDVLDDFVQASRAAAVSM